MSKKKYQLTADAIRIILVVLGSIFSTLVLTFSVLAIFELQNSNIEGASIYLLGIFIVLGLSRLINFLKERTKISLARFLSLLIVDIALGIIILFAKDNPYLFSLCGGLYCLTIIASRIFKIIQNHTIRSIIYNLLIIAFSALLAIGLFISSEGGESFSILIICLLVAISSFFEVISNATTQLKFRVLFKIILRTYALEVILGLLTTMVAFSLVFMLYEENINSIGDGLWYSFTVVTTIGFGDFTATTLVGRILTVILGIYGIIVVALITSIIVNFYNETTGKKDAQELREIQNEEKKNQ